MEFAQKIKELREVTRKAQTEPEYRKTLDMNNYWSQVKDLSNESVFKNTLKIAVLGYKVPLIGQWDPFDVTKGLPGSEECAVYGSQELANRGYEVTVYMDPPKDSIWTSPFSNPRWVPEDYWNDNSNKAKYDLLLMWRRFDVETGRRRSKIVFFWGHDSPPDLKPGQIFNPFPKFDGVCILTEHHRKQFSIWPGFNNIPYIISGNGILLEHFNNPMNIRNPYSIGYFSNYSRGLIILILLWPMIKKEFPEATLDICYGRETWNTIHPDQLKFIINRIEAYKSLGVTEHGKVGHIELAQIMQHTSVWCYPTSCLGETFCITAVKCQAAGCIPITTRVAALNETVHPDAPHIDVIQSNDDITKYYNLVIKTLNRIRDSNPEDIKIEREKYIEYGKQYTWTRCVDKWLQLYNRVK